ncbi:Central component in molecular interactions underlying sperm crawling [Perkinsus chesapeaki]|uniref:Central component in molecular interactions underlying sperm crawling n=1 Tax=Perkinsus chesapeaki TaxID=330153 RepID=A0A7J6MDJ1_PERCH|nr:Central component in molecular interactions underlying sperm crawling [Perkinsus chesapeaki]
MAGSSLVTVKPGEITFPTTLYQSVTTILRLDNKTDKKRSVAYKIKTTAPRKYLVRPSSGVIGPGESADIQIILQPQTADPSNDHDRFLIQTAVSKSGRSLDREEWGKLAKGEVEEQKIRVVFKAAPAASEPSPEAPSGGDGSDDLRAKYDELIQYTLSVEKDKRRLEKEIEAVKQSGQGSSSVGGFSTVTLLISMMIAVILARVAALFGY